MRATERRPNVLLLVLDSTRADRLSCYGYRDETTPNIDRIADEGIRFENAIATAPWTLPSHGSMFTGRLPSDHGGHTKSMHLPEGQPTLAACLADVGYRTIAVSNNGWLSESTGLLRGFDTVYELWKYFQTDTDFVAPYREHLKRRSLTELPRGLWNFLAELLEHGNLLRDLSNVAYGGLTRDTYHHAGGRITDSLLSECWSGRAPFFAVANYLEPHFPCMPPGRLRDRFLPDVPESEIESVPQDERAIRFSKDPLTERERTILEGLYAGEIALLDEYIGRVYSELRHRNALDDTLIVLVGDHGEHLGEHGLVGHNSSLYDGVLRVPLIIRPPGGSDGDRTVDSIVQPSDIYRTVLEFCGCAHRRDDREFSFDLLSGSGRPNMAIAQYGGLAGQFNKERILEAYENVNEADFVGPMDAIYRDDDKLIRVEGDPVERYDLTADPTESRNVLGMDERLENELVSHLDSVPQTPITEIDCRNGVAMAGDVSERLRQMGYL